MRPRGCSKILREVFARYFEIQVARETLFVNEIQHITSLKSECIFSFTYTFQVIICLYASSEFIIIWFHTTRFSWVRLMQAEFTPTDGTRTAGIAGQGTRYDNISSINNAKCPVSPQRLLPVVTGRLAAKFHWSSGRLSIEANKALNCYIVSCG